MVGERPHEHSFIGLRVMADRPLPSLADRFTPDGEVGVDTVSPASGREFPVDEPAWHPIPAAGRDLDRVRGDGGSIRLGPSDGGVVPKPDAAAARVRQALPFASLLQGRGVLHAAAVSVGDGVVALVGASGVGKSTLAGELSRHGLDPLADDLLPCRLANGRVMVPGRVGGVAGTDGVGPRALIKVLFLERRRGLARVESEPVAGSCLLRLLGRHGFGNLAVPVLWEAQLELHLEIARRCDAWEVRVPDDRSRIAATAAVLAAWLERP